MVSEQTNSIPIIQTLLQELASEIDLHYEDEDFFALEPTIQAMSPAIEFLESNHAEVPDVVDHVLKRYLRSKH